MRDVQEMYKQNENSTGISVYQLALEDLLMMFKGEKQKDEQTDKISIENSTKICL